MRGWEHMTPELMAQREKKQGLRPVTRYHSKRTVVDGISFMSKAEAARYAHLKLLEQMQQISGLILQPRFNLHVNGQKVGAVIFDFEYRTGIQQERVIEDVKGYDPVAGSGTLSRWKRRHFELEYGITIQVIKK